MTIWCLPHNPASFLIPNPHQERGETGPKVFPAAYVTAGREVAVEKECLITLCRFRRWSDIHRAAEINPYTLFTTFIRTGFPGLQ